MTRAMVVVLAAAMGCGGDRTQDGPSGAVNGVLPSPNGQCLPDTRERPEGYPDAALPGCLPASPDAWECAGAEKQRDGSWVCLDGRAIMPWDPAWACTAPGNVDAYRELQTVGRFGGRPGVACNGEVCTVAKTVCQCQVNDHCRLDGDGSCADGACQFAP